MRWPVLAQYLEKEHDKLDLIGSRKSDEIGGLAVDDSIKKLLLDAEVDLVKQGAGVGGPLNQDDIINFTASGSAV